MLNATRISDVAGRVMPLALIVLLGTALRLWGIGFGLPFTTIADEPTYLSISLRMLQTGDLNPRWWYYPTLMFYLNAGALALYVFVSRLAGTLTNPGDLVFPEIVAMGVGQIAKPEEFLIARGLTVLFGVVGIIVVYFIVRRFHENKNVARLAALLFALSPTVVRYSQRIGPDQFALFFSMASFLFAMRIVDAPTLRNYLAAGIFAGLAIASKYNAGLILIALLAAHFVRFGRIGWRRREMFIALIAAGLVFVVVTPYAALDFPSFWEGIRFQADSYTIEGHVGEQGDAFQWYVAYLWTTEGLAILFGALCGILFLFARSPRRLVLVSFPLLYFLFVSQLFTRNARTIMLILPYLFVLAAAALVLGYEWIVANSRLPRAAILLGVLTIGALMIALPLKTTIAADARLMQTDARDAAREWLIANLPPRTRVVLEAYSPYLDTRQFIVQGVFGILDHPADWYAQNGFEYLVLSQGMYGRFFAEPVRYADWVARYNEYFARYPEIKRFSENGYEVRVYKTGVALPAHRVDARFGDYGELVELIGYDVVDSKWTPGAPLRVKLFWRVFAQNEPFEVEFRLLDRNDREVGRARGDLYQGRGWQEGMIATEWTIPSEPNIAPGEYRLQVSPVQMRYNYPLPAKNWAGDDLGALLLDISQMNGP